MHKSHKSSPTCTKIIYFEFKYFLCIWGILLRFDNTYQYAIINMVFCIFLRFFADASLMHIIFADGEKLMISFSSAFI